MTSCCALVLTVSSDAGSCNATHTIRTVGLLMVDLMTRSCRSPAGSRDVDADQDGSTGPIKLKPAPSTCQSRIDILQ